MEKRRLSNYSIKVILCSHYRSRYKPRDYDKIKSMDLANMQREVTCAAHYNLNRAEVT